MKSHSLLTAGLLGATVSRDGKNLWRVIGIYLSEVTRGPRILTLPCDQFGREKEGAEISDTELSGWKVHTLSCAARR